MTFNYNKHNRPQIYILWPVEEEKWELGQKQIQRQSGNKCDIKRHTKGMKKQEGETKRKG